MNLAIPHFGLYGESAWQDDPALIHSENIASRSSPLGWVIEAHRHNQMYQCLLVESGDVTLRLDERSYTTQGPCIVWIPPGVVHSFQFSKDTKGAVVSVSQYLLSNAFEGRSNLTISDTLQTAFVQHFNKDLSHWVPIRETQKQLQKELDSSQYGKSLVCESLMLVLVIYICRCQTNEPTQETGSNNRLFIAFQRLVDEHYKNHLTADKYAAKLNITPSKLNRMVKHITGLSAKQFVQQRLVIEIKRRLLYTRQSADAIAYESGFKDPGYFSRFFKRATGQTPGKFRQDHRL